MVARLMVARLMVVRLIVTCLIIPLTSMHNTILQTYLASTHYSYVHALQTSLHRQAALFAIKYICIQDFKKNVWWNSKKPLYIFFAWMHGFFKTSSFELKTLSFE